MLFAIMRHYGIPEKIVNSIRALYKDSTSQVFIDGHLSPKFNVTTGVLQGDVLAPFLFIMVIDYISRLSKGDYGYITHKGAQQTESVRSTRATTVSQRQIERKINELTFADDMAQLENDQTRAQQQLISLRDNARKAGLEININKTEQMCLNITDQLQNLTLDGEEIKIVEDFKYLGSYV